MKKTFIAVTAAAVLVSLSGCFGTSSGTSPDIVGSYVNEGNIEAAEEYLMDKCRNNRSDSAYNNYLNFLAKNGKLDFLRENFPSDEELIFMGKPLSEYDTQELLDMAGIETIGYRKETSLSQTVNYYNEEAEKTPLPYGMEQSMSYRKVLETIGFTEEQAELLENICYIYIDCSGESFVIDAKKSQYAAFSQHPAEMWEFNLRYGSAMLCFKSYGNDICEYTLTVYF